MGGQMRIYRQRTKSVQSMKKITNAMELIAASRVVKARQRVTESTPYALALTKVMSAVVTHAEVDHPLTTEREQVRRAAVVIVTSDRGLAGAYSVNVMKRAAELVELLHSEGKEVVPYLVGRKAVSYYKFRKRDFAGEWTDFSDNPNADVAREIGSMLTEQYLAGSDEGGVDEVHIVYTRFVNMVSQVPDVLRLLPLEVVEADDAEDVGPGVVDEHSDRVAIYDFEPSAEKILDQLLPLYVNARVYNCLLQAAASELAQRQRAMKSATDNAEELIKTYTRLANQARQAEITQEISEIVGGASALADAK